MKSRDETLLRMISSDDGSTTWSSVDLKSSSGAVIRARSARSGFQPSRIIESAALSGVRA